ncbi:MAG: hypothetical protein HWE25_03725 [Alphaproteobacteria bacterium]|nr:hypothetical protein [Alphaproteobacteria bacterium]
MVRKISLWGLVAAGLAISPVAAETPLSDVLMDKAEGCMTGPVSQFGRYVGDWNIEDHSLSRDDGETWVPGNGARWNFTCVGNGIAVQDFWMPNGPDGKPAGRVGTNLRIFDPASNQWEIAWTATNTPGFMHIQARQNADGDIVMNIVRPVQDPPRRIIFFPPTDEGWNWVMEISQDEGISWTPVYKITATRR